jgi:small subunit ribosomal protein S4
MARYRGPKSKIARKFGDAIFGADKAFEKKKYPPGMHGVNKRRKKQSEYGIQLQEKQKAKYTYGLLEKQFSNLFEKATRKKGITGEILLQLLESRLDNVVYRMGIAPSRRAARQLVGHKHITVNGDVVNIASYTLRPGDVVGVREKSKSLEVVSDSLNGRANIFNWLEWDQQKLEG